MKKPIIILFSALLLVGAISCKKVINAIFQGFDVTVPDIQVTIPAVIAVAPSEIALGTFSIPFNLDSIVKSRTAGVFGANAVSSIKVKQMSITITNADQMNNLANFESARVTIHSNTNSSPTEIFSATFPDVFASTYTSTPVNSQELLSYLKGSEIIYKMYGKNRRITTKPLNIVISVIIRTS